MTLVQEVHARRKRALLMQENHGKVRYATLRTHSCARTHKCTHSRTHMRARASALERARAGRVRERARMHVRGLSGWSRECFALQLLELLEVPQMMDMCVRSEFQSAS